MKIRKVMRLVSLAMFAIAVVFVFCALSCPTLGQTIWIGGFAFGAEQWRFCYGVYALVMAGLFLGSFFLSF